MSFYDLYVDNLDNTRIYVVSSTSRVIPPDATCKIRYVDATIVCNLVLPFKEVDYTYSGLCLTSDEVM